MFFLISNKQLDTCLYLTNMNWIGYGPANKKALQAQHPIQPVCSLVLPCLPAPHAQLNHRRPLSVSVQVQVPDTRLAWRRPAAAKQSVGTPVHNYSTYGTYKDGARQG